MFGVRSFEEQNFCVSSFLTELIVRTQGVRSGVRFGIGLLEKLKRCIEICIGGLAVDRSK